jgi:Helix-turn-helix domain
MPQDISIYEPALQTTRAPAGYLTEAEVADQLGVKIGTLRVWACRKKGPPGRVSVGRKAFYREEALSDWLRAKEQDSAGAAEKRPAPQARRALSGDVWNRSSANAENS